MAGTKAKAPLRRKSQNPGRRIEDQAGRMQTAAPLDAPFISTEQAFDRKLGLLMLGLALVIGAALRVWLSLHDDGIYWPDEIYQSLEPAHRLVFGYGLLSWEFIQGARNWAFPGLVALLLKLCASVDLGQPRQYLLVVKLVFSAASVATAYGTYRLARAYQASTLASACGAAFVALVAPAIYFAPRALSESASALALVFGFALALAPDSRRPGQTLGASLVGLSVLLRLQSGIFALGLLAILAGRRKWRQAGESAAILIAWALLFGLLDKIAWGGWFHSAILYLQVNLLQGKATQLGQGSAPPDYYLRYFWLSAGGAATLLPGAFFLYGSWRAPGLFVTALVYLMLHIATPHKELRFLLPVLPFLGALAAVGLDTLRREIARLRTGRYNLFHAVAGVVFLSVLISAASFHSLTFGDLGSYLTTRPQVSAYDDSGSVNRLLLAAYGQGDLCGIEIQSVNLTWTGGYSYLHRDVPLYPAWGPPLTSEQFNYVITLAAARPPGDVIATDKDQALVRLAQRGCVPDPSYHGTV